PPDSLVKWRDRRLGECTQQVNDSVGDFVLRRADGVWSYQFAVVTDDARQGITHVVRGEDLADNTPRQILLQQALGLPTPVYLHTPLVLDAAGEKLSKQQGAPALDTHHPLKALQAAALSLGLSSLNAHHATTPAEALQHWVNEWRDRWAASLQSVAR
ncbi:MAG: glutamate--tRNA ligase family protein, partial [Limnohabitans sp.]